MSLHSQPKSATISQAHQDYEKFGYCVVDDFLPEDIALRLNALYVGEETWEQHNQVREHHYEHVFKTDAACLPAAGEHYIAKFGRSKNLEALPEFQHIYDNVIRPRIAQEIGYPLTQSDIRCYRLLQGDLYRTHIDDYAGDVGLIYYLNKRWVWDWGGILHVCQDGNAANQKAEAILPQFNRAVLVDHGRFRFPHFISSVEPFALEPRYTIISFNR